MLTVMADNLSSRYVFSLDLVFGRPLGTNLIRRRRSGLGEGGVDQRREEVDHEGGRR